MKDSAYYYYHRDRLRSLVYHAQARKLISTSDDGVMGIWNMDIERQEVCTCMFVCHVHVHVIW